MVFHKKNKIEGIVGRERVELSCRLRHTCRMPWWHWWHRAEPGLGQEVPGSRALPRGAWGSWQTPDQPMEGHSEWVLLSWPCVRRGLVRTTMEVSPVS